MVSSGGVVWCLKDNKWIPLQLSSIRLHGVVTQAQWALVSDFLKKFSNQPLVLQENGIWTLTDKQNEQLMLQKQLSDSLGISTDIFSEQLVLEKQIVESTKNLDVLVLPKPLPRSVSEEDKEVRRDERTLDAVRRHSLSQIPETAVEECRLFKNSISNGVSFRRNSISHEIPRQKSSIAIERLFKETENINNNHEKLAECVNKPADNKLCEDKRGRTQRRPSEQSDEIVLRLLRKYSKYNKEALDNSFLSAIELKKEEVDESYKGAHKPTVPVRTRKKGYLPKLEKLYENCGDINGRRYSGLSICSYEVEQFENERNEHVLRWLKQQQENENEDLYFKNDLWESLSSEGKRKHSLASKSSSSSGFESRKSSVVSTVDENCSSRKSSLVSSPTSTTGSRKSSWELLNSRDNRKSSVVSTSSCSDGEDFALVGSGGSGQWSKMIKKHFGDPKKNLENRIKKQREAWARNTRKLSSGSESAPTGLLQLEYSE